MTFFRGVERANDTSTGRLHIGEIDTLTGGGRERHFYSGNRLHSSNGNLATAGVQPTMPPIEISKLMM